MTINTQTNAVKYTTLEVIRMLREGKVTEVEAAKLLDAAKQPVGGARPITFKVGDKGGVSVYGMGRFPITLYREQWERLIAVTPQLKEFIDANASRLKLKGDADAA